jgi:hypothetical protein
MLRKISAWKCGGDFRFQPFIVSKSEWQGQAAAGKSEAESSPNRLFPMFTDLC